MVSAGEGHRQQEVHDFRMFQFLFAHALARELGGRLLAGYMNKKCLVVGKPHFDPLIIEHDAFGPAGPHQWLQRSILGGTMAVFRIHGRDDPRQVYRLLSAKFSHVQDELTVV